MPSRVNVVHVVLDFVRPAAVLAVLLLSVLLIHGCATKPPRDSNNICAIFSEKKRWYRAAKQSEQRWGTPLHIQMAIIKQESSFRHDAKPPRRKILGIIPAGRRSSSYGYAQAKDETWDWYKQSTGHRRADRDDFSDAIDFVGWYSYQSHQLAGISKWDPYRQYLAYHEGHTGFKRGSWQNKQWLKDVAKRVDATARTWGAQLKSCRGRL